MPIPMMNIPFLSPQQASPLAYGFNMGQDILASIQQAKLNQMNAQKLQQQMPFVAPMAQAELTGKQQANQWNPQIWKSEIGLRGSQAKEQEALASGHLTENQINQLKLNYLKQMLSGNASQGISGQQGIPASQATGAGGVPSAGQGVYGIQTPQPTQQDMMNKMLFNMDTFTPRMENAKTQQEDQYKKFEEKKTAAARAANAASSMSNAMSVFNNAMDRSFYTGPSLGSLPSSGMATMMMPGSLAPEQEADRAAMQMLPEAISTIRDAMGQARFSNLDMNMSREMKFSRTMDPETRKTMTNWVSGVNQRLNEEAKFYEVMGKPEMGVSESTAEMLWSAYQQAYPLINAKGDTYLASNLGNWPLYTTPKAIDSIMRTGSYTPSKGEMNSVMMKLPDGSIVPIKKGSVESAFRKGARPL